MARTDNDTWDLASSVGSTATMVAAQRVLSHREGLIDDPYAEPLVRAVGLDFFVRALDGEISLDAIDPRFNTRRAAEGMAVRTRHFDRLFTDAAAAGVRQAVILAAGLDARAYRLGWPTGTAVFELDQPEVIAFKSDTLAALGAEPSADRHVVAIDLRDDWPKALRDNGFDPSQPTAWIAEGLLIYLPPEAQDLLFDRIDDLSAPGSRVATEHIPDVSMFSDERSREIAEKLQAYGQNIEMGELIYHGERNDVVDYLTDRGWDVTTQKMPDAYAANGFTFDEDSTIGLFSDMSYLSAIKR
ncbi:SAM-dependent methyltransferase [Mycolicibacterium novocastrense]|uniref:class I SAM-dependent methyltransferase n=1 Tax=Mycolicibacterium novocastrense TaxID=59813 RepID=UPI00074667CB|nr:class I SAM-dependent methyltransferase [Mycolicibacterium novocastrense]KUH68000.1 SAM-dependent methyltransferase [Mycolicibacterium novocastrense]KUH68472.1 SAM-dependent methyltransferase [Mycolicibacterium novocastrense]KUH73553.1 SAM-dependent methyltransferase [Mycolicibacterium novocastrense]